MVVISEMNKMCTLGILDVSGVSNGHNLTYMYG